jgi:hypothetical protein
MSKHTPGPWKFSEADNNSTEFYIQFDHSRAENYKHIASSAGAIAKLPPSKFHNQQANAQLIAAAPDLLEALEFVAKNCAADLTHSEADKIISIARKAIARAKGESE